MPDLVTLAKGLGGGFPIGAVIGPARGRAACSAPAPRQHLRRQPGGLRGGLATLHVIDRDGLVATPGRGGAVAARRLAAAHPLVTSVGGEGLLRASRWPHR